MSPNQIVKVGRMWIKFIAIFIQSNFVKFYLATISDFILELVAVKNLDFVINF